jgi:prevent-host-death family protein
MTAHVGIRQLRSDVAAVVRRAAAGEKIVITVSGQSVALLSPVATSEHTVGLDDLVARGLVIPPRRISKWVPSAPVKVWSDPRIDLLLREIR